MPVMNLTINQKGTSFYEKWTKDTKYGVIFYAPALLLFCLGIGIVIYGLTVKFVLISIFPVVLISNAFVRPYYRRKNTFNQMIKSIALSDNAISIETYRWFAFNPIVESIPANDLIVNDSADSSFFKGKRIHLLKVRGSQTEAFLLIDEFFDDIDSLLHILDPKSLCLTHTITHPHTPLQEDDV